MKTALYENHQALNAKLTDFGGWQMPLQYKGALFEQKMVRESVGLFDVSHMGRISIEGSDAEKLLDLLSTNQIAGKPNLTATYTGWCLPSGGCVDDLIIYRYSSEKFFAIVNASNRQKDLAHLKSYAEGFNVTIYDHFMDGGILALQGPKAYLLMQQLFPKACELKPMHFMEITYQDEPLVISATGYTGAGGFEFYGNGNIIKNLWEQLLISGKPLGIEPIGLAARDILRLEMGYALYGHEINESIAPTESVMAWAVKLNKNEFIGKEALLKLADSKKMRAEQGLQLLDPGILREGYPVFKEGRQIGTITSGGFSPTLNKSVAIALLETKEPLGQQVEVAIRKNLCKAQIVALPFIKK